MGSKLIHIKRLFIALITMVTSLSLCAQDNLTMADKAARIINRPKLTKQDVINARDTILLALQQESEMDDPYAWLVKGFVFKEMYKVVDDSVYTSVNREIAVEALGECMRLDKDRAYKDECTGVLEFLASSYFNDSANLTLSNDESAFQISDELFNKSRKIERMIDPTADLKQWDINFHLNKAKAYTKLYERDPAKNPETIEKAIDNFKVALVLDSTIHDANFNVATAYYNMGVYKVRKINANTEFDSLIKIQDECIQLFIKALPYMQRAYNVRPRHKDTLKGMWFINRALSEDEKAEYYRGEMERLIKNGTIEEGSLPRQK